MSQSYFFALSAMICLAPYAHPAVAVVIGAGNFIAAIYFAYKGK